MEDNAKKSTKKIKLLVVPSDRTGVGKFRSIDPHITLQKLYPNDFHVDIEYNPKDINQLRNYDLIHIHRSMGDYEQTRLTLEQLKKDGIPTIVDIDDFWLPTKEHPVHELIKQHKIDKAIIANLNAAQYVTTTTSIYADHMKKVGVNKNVFVFPNAIDPTQKQFQPKPEDSDLIRIGWLGGSSHLHDLMLLGDVVDKTHREFPNKAQFVLCGYDLRGTMTYVDPNTKETKQRPIKPEESVWFQYEKIFTSSNSLTEDYRRYLSLFKKTPPYEDKSLPYRRRWTRPVTTYAENYNYFDISLAPLKEHIFNEMKSQLKVIEAGFHKKALIAQDFGPYTIDLINAVEKGGKFNDKGNALLVNSRRNHKQWYQHVKRLIKEPELIKVLGNNLYETVKEKYNVDKVARDRAEFYKSIV